MKNIISLISGIIFAIGLVISGMVNPEKVIGFLDIFREWDYSLAFVMGGAIGVNLLFYKLVLSKKPLFADAHSLPLNKSIDKKLIIGSALFGIGWGLAGICPGPGIVNLVTLKTGAFWFVGSMLVGMGSYKLIFK
ncbi:YeeE/YedE family protein [Bacteriovoracaceae bacterium]|nr:YeeE/YedE family protein [Bacteriovoracaceae bacterium]|tara:strand:- start:92947 stop:93351 length:405 start_codon:yes stop_codon:yes gene_type:complete